MRAILPNEANKRCIFKDNTFVTYIAAWSLLPTRDKTCRGLDPVNRIKRRQAQVERNRVPRCIHGYPSCTEPALDFDERSAPRCQLARISVPERERVASN